MTSWTVLATALLLVSSAFAAPVNTTAPARGCASHKSPEDVAIAEARFTNNFHSIASIDIAAALKPIPVVWHVISKSNTLAGGNIPDSQISASIDAMNDHYSGTGFTFTLQKTTRTTNAAWFTGVGPDEAAQTTMKTQLREGDANTLNIYSVGFASGSGQGLLGYATFPSDYEGNPKDDGIVPLYSSVPGGSTANFDEGKTLSHETGHWLGLYHVFQGGCSAEGDMVADTPPQSTATSGCPKSQDSCPGGGVDSIHNYMDYSYDSCMNEWTPGQITRAQQQTLTFRQGGSAPGPTVQPTDAPEEPTEAPEEPIPTEEEPLPTETEPASENDDEESNCPKWWPNCPWA